MALQQAHTTDSGVSGNYWRVLETNINYAQRQSRVTLGLYRDETARREERQVLEVRSYDWREGDTQHQPSIFDPETGELVAQTPILLSWPFAISEMDSANPVAIAYQAIKARDLLFADAEDC